MTERSVTHATFVVERTYAASSGRVFAAFADPAIKKRWYASPLSWARSWPGHLADPLLRHSI